MFEPPSPNFLPSVWLWSSLWFVPCVFYCSWCIETACSCAYPLCTHQTRIIWIILININFIILIYKLINRVRVLYHTHTHTCTLSLPHTNSFFRTQAYRVSQSIRIRNPRQCCPGFLILLKPCHAIAQEAFLQGSFCRCPCLVGMQFWHGLPGNFLSDHEKGTPWCHSSKKYI